MVKLPVTRFTMPQVREESQHWFQMLSGVYCTFTVCNVEGQVIGCVDVPGPRDSRWATRRASTPCCRHATSATGWSTLITCRG